MRKLLIVFAVALAAAACGKKVEMDPVLYESDEISLMVKGKKVFSYTEGTMQLSTNPVLGQFRAGNDDMTQFFVLSYGTRPREKGQELKGDVEWTSGNSVKKTTGLTFKVEKLDANTGLVWLWCASDKTGAVIKLPN